MSRIRTNIITNRMANGAPTVSNGLVISGVTTTSDIKVGTNIILTTTGNGNFSGIVTATTFSGSGASLTSIPAGNLTGTVADARIASLTASKLSGALPAIDGSNLTGIDTDLSYDTSPQLGGTLDAGSRNIFFGDGNGNNTGELRFGNGTDLRIFHDGNNSFIRNTTNDLNITNTGDDIVITANDDINLKTNAGDNAVNILGGAAVELYHNASKKFETTSYGALVTGNLSFADNGKASFGASGDLQIFHSGSNSFINDLGTGGVIIAASKTNIMNSSAGENMAVFNDNGAVELYYDNEKMFQTNQDGAEFFDSDNNLNLYFTCNGTRRGYIFVESTNGGKISLYDNQNHPMLSATKDGAVDLYHNNTKRFETTSDGVKISGDLRFDSPPTKAISLPDDKRIYLGNSDDLEIWHSPNNNSYIKNSTGQLFLASDNIALKTTDQSETFIDCNGNGNVELYHDNTKQCETSANGLAFPSGKGIDFSADASGTLKTLPNSFNAEVLHDYEVGTFVPNISYDTGTNQYYGSVGSGQNVASAKGEYIRIGDLVSFAGEITLTGNRSSTQNVHISIGGLPYNGLHSSEQSSLMTGWGGAAWPKNDSNPSYRLIYAWHAYTTLNFYFYQASGNNGIDGFRFHGYYRCAP